MTHAYGARRDRLSGTDICPDAMTKTRAAFARNAPFFRYHKEVAEAHRVSATTYNLLCQDNVPVGRDEEYRARDVYRPSRLLRDSLSGSRSKSPCSTVDLPLHRFRYLTSGYLGCVRIRPQ